MGEREWVGEGGRGWKKEGEVGGREGVGGRGWERVGEGGRGLMYMFNFAECLTMT